MTAEATANDGFWGFSLRIYARPDVPQACLALQDEGGGGGRWDFDMKIPPRGCALVYVNEARERDRGNFLPLRSQFTGYSQVDALDVNRQYAACQATTMVCVQSEVWMRQ